MKFTDKITKEFKQTYKITVTIPWSEVENSKLNALTRLKKATQVEGFRKGNAPDKLVREKLGENKLLEEGVRGLLSHIYGDLIKKHNLKPFIDPGIHVIKAEPNKDWEVEFHIAEVPVLTKLADYRAIGEKVKGELKKSDIWVPGKDEKPAKEDEQKKKNDKIQKMFNELLDASEIEISPLIMEQETNRRLVSLYEEIKKLGLTVEQYLKTKNETQESLKHKVVREISDMYKSEFILEAIAEKEKITVGEKDLEEVFKTAKSDKEKETLKQNSYFYSRLMRKQRTLEFLGEL